MYILKTRKIESQRAFCVRQHVPFRVIATLHGLSVSTTRSLILHQYDSVVVFISCWLLHDAESELHGEEDGCPQAIKKACRVVALLFVARGEEWHEVGHWEGVCGQRV